MKWRLLFLFSITFAQTRLKGNSFSHHKSILLVLKLTPNDILVNHFVRKGHPVFQSYFSYFNFLQSCLKDPADRVLKKLLVTNNYRSNVRPSFGIRTDSRFVQIKPVWGL